jgi:hypothetical protein
VGHDAGRLSDVPLLRHGRCQSLLFSQIDEPGSELVLVENFR